MSESETQDKQQTKENAQNSKDEDAQTLTKENTDETKSSKDRRHNSDSKIQSDIA